MSDIEELILSGRKHLVLKNADKYNLNRVLIAKDGRRFRLNVKLKNKILVDALFDSINEAKSEFLKEFRFWTAYNNLHPVWQESLLPGLMIGAYLATLAGECGAGED
ncbi:MAG: hypothetical protein GY765_05450 [bacterium]|nr:hypothetical protein [bacterium]